MTKNSNQGGSCLNDGLEGSFVCCWVSSVEFSLLPSSISLVLTVPQLSSLDSFARSTLQIFRPSYGLSATIAHICLIVQLTDLLLDKAARHIYMGALFFLDMRLVFFFLSKDLNRDLCTREGHQVNREDIDCHGQITACRFHRWLLRYPWLAGSWLQPLPSASWQPA